MKQHAFGKSPATVAACLLGLALPAFAAPFSSGSTGADGALAPTVNVTIPLPPGGVLHYTTVDIPAGVTVRFSRNSANTPVTLLATGLVKIAGAIDVSGGSSLATTGGQTGDVGLGGVAGPGGFAGARGGLQDQNRVGGTGFGPGGGGGGIQSGSCSNMTQGGGGGGYAGTGDASACIRTFGFLAGERTGFLGASYGSNSMFPLIGGSGGGGGAGGPSIGSFPGTGGGGGGGALMLVATGGVELTGSIRANGGSAGNAGDCNSNTRENGGGGGGGSGGAVRILTPSLTGAGTIQVNGGSGGCRATGANLNGFNSGGNGSVGRSSVEIVTGGSFNPGITPTLSITSIGGVPVPPSPTGAGDVDLPGSLPNPVSVSVAATGIPLGTVVSLTVFQPYGTNLTGSTSALAGTLAASTASGTVNIPLGPSVIMATTTFALTLAQGEAAAQFALGERVDRIGLAAAAGGETRVTLITVSGKEYDVPAALLASILG